MSYHRRPSFHGVVDSRSLQGVDIAIHGRHQQVHVAIVVQVICQHHAVGLLTNVDGVCTACNRNAGLCEDVGKRG